MKKIILYLAMAASLPAAAQMDYSNDVNSIDQIISTLYAVISGEKGEPRDWDRFRNLFKPDARLIPSNKGPEGVTTYRILTPNDYVTSAGERLEKLGFYEVEINRLSEAYGSMVHIWSTYESYHSKTEKQPFARGINSIQLLNDGKRWWILQVYWLAETPENPLPPDYLPVKR